MAGTERAQPVQVCLNRIVYESCRVHRTWEGVSKPSHVHSCLNRIVYESGSVLWTCKGLSEPSLFTFVLKGLFTSLVSVI